MDASTIDYLPIVSTVVAGSFTWVLWHHWRQAPRKRYLLWWMIGIAFFGIGTLAEALTTVFGWSEGLFRAWYISGALLGGAPLAQGTVYLLLPKKKADRLAIALISYITIATTFVLTTPVVTESAATQDLTGEVMEWQWVRLFSPLVNSYAAVFLIGGAAWSAWQFWKRSEGSRARAIGNVLIAVGGLLPGIGGGFARAGHVRVLYVTELIGLTFIYLGYRRITADRGPSIQQVQGRRREVAAMVMSGTARKDQS